MSKNIFFLIGMFFFCNYVFADSTNLQEQDSPVRGQLIFGNGGGFEYCSIDDGLGETIHVLQVINISPSATSGEPCTEKHDNANYIAKGLYVPNDAYFVDQYFYKTLDFSAGYYLSTTGQASLENLLYNSEKRDNVGRTDLASAAFYSVCTPNQDYGCYSGDLFEGITTNVHIVYNDSDPDPDGLNETSFFDFDYTSDKFGLTVGDLEYATMVFDLTDSTGDLANIMTFKKTDAGFVPQPTALNPEGSGVVIGTAYGGTEPVLGIYPSASFEEVFVGIGTQRPQESVTVSGNLTIGNSGSLIGEFGVFPDPAVSIVNDCEADYVIASDTGTVTVLADEEISPQYVSHNIMAFANVNLLHNGRAVLLIDLLDSENAFYASGMPGFYTANNADDGSYYASTQGYQEFWPAAGNGDYIDTNYNYSDGSDDDQNIIARSVSLYDGSSAQYMYHISNSLTQTVPPVDSDLEYYTVQLKLLCEDVSTSYDSGARGYMKAANDPDAGLRQRFAHGSGANVAYAATAASFASLWNYVSEVGTGSGYRAPSVDSNGNVSSIQYAPLYHDNGSGFGNTYYLRWEGYFTPPTTQSYMFRTWSDDASFVLINGSMVTNNGGGHGMVTRDSSWISLTAGVEYFFEVYFGEWYGGDKMYFWWKGNTTNTSWQSSLSTYFADSTKPSTSLDDASGIALNFDDDFAKQLYVIGMPLGEIGQGAFSDSIAEVVSNIELMSAQPATNVTFLTDNQLSLAGSSKGANIMDFSNRIVMRDSDGALINFRAQGLNASTIYEKLTVTLSNDYMIGQADTYYQLRLGSYDSGNYSDLLFSSYTEEFEFVSTNIQVVADTSGVIVDAGEGFSSGDTVVKPYYITNVGTDPILSFPFGIDVGNNLFLSANWSGSTLERGVGVNTAADPDYGLKVYGNLMVSGSIDLDYGYIYYSTCQTLNNDCYFDNDEDSSITTVTDFVVYNDNNDSQTKSIEWNAGALPTTADYWNVYIFFSSTVWCSWYTHATAYMELLVDDVSQGYVPAVQFAFGPHDSHYPFVMIHNFTDIPNTNSSGSVLTVKLYLHNHSYDTMLVIDPLKLSPSNTNYMTEGKGRHWYTTEMDLTVMALPSG